MRCLCIGFNFLITSLTKNWFLFLVTAEKPESMKKGRQYCMICKCNIGHGEWNCPNRSKGMGMACVKCFQPCEIEEHKKDFIRIYKYCLRCEVNGDHWSKDCPDPIYDDNDMYY